ncbi:MAG: hypothetical protein ACYDCH_14650 [Gaiellaceae bacterium]
MRFKTMLLAGACALALAAPAAADSTAPPQALAPELVPGAGLSGIAGVHAVRYRFVRALGATAAGSFRIDFGAGPGNKVVLVRRGQPTFRALRVTSIRWAANALRMQGVGIVGGRRVQFSALAVDNGLRDVFKLDWQHRASLGGLLTHGSIVIH